MKNRSVISEISLIIIAICCVMNTFDSSKVPQATLPEPVVVQVLGRASVSNYEFGDGTYGFIVKNGDRTELMEYDPGSMFDRMKLPNLLLVTVQPDGQRLIVPLEEQQQ